MSSEFTGKAICLAQVRSWPDQRIKVLVDCCCSCLTGSLSDVQAVLQQSKAQESVITHLAPSWWRWYSLGTQARLSQLS